MRTRTAPPDAGPHLTIPELAEREHVPVDTVYKWNVTGAGPVYLRIGRHVRYRLADVIAWEESRAVRHAGEWV